MKNIYNVNKNLTVITPKSMEFTTAVIFRKAFSIQKTSDLIEGKLPPNKNNKVWEPSFMQQF